MTVADALHRAAEAIRALPDRDLLELALRAEEPALPPLVPAVASAPPTAAPRQEVAKSAPRPTGRGSARAAEAAAKRQGVLDLLRNGPLPRDEIASRLGLTEGSTHRALTALVDSGQIVRPPLRGDRWRLR